MALYPFILLQDPRDRANPRLLNHERIHLRQQAEMLVLPFYLCYLLHYTINVVRGQAHDRAYRQICFEREAYTHDQNLAYLSQRSPWAFWDYLGF